MKHFLFITLLFTYFFGYSQDSKNTRLVQMADSIVRLNSSQQFLDFIRFNDDNVKHWKEFDYSNPNLNLNKLGDTNYINKFLMDKYSVIFKEIKIDNANICFENDSTYYCALENLGIEFDSSLIAIKIPDFKTLEIAYSGIKEAKIISSQDAIRITGTKFTIDTDSACVLFLSYNLRNDSIYWIVSKFSKNKLLNELIKINAKTGDFNSRLINEVEIRIK